MTDDLEMHYLNDPDYDSFPLKQRLEECVQSLILKNLEYEELQATIETYEQELLGDRARLE